MEPDLRKHCFACSCLYDNDVKVCPANPKHQLNLIDMNSPEIRAFREVRQAEVRITGE